VFITPENKIDLGINSLDDLMKEVLRFKLYVFVKATEELNNKYTISSQSLGNCNKPLKLTLLGMDVQDLPFSPLLPQGQTDQFEISQLINALASLDAAKTYFDSYDSYFSDGSQANPTAGLFQRT
jgi:hypothetical protein